jgi:putative tricarboxylic transport membrane protein
VRKYNLIGGFVWLVLSIFISAESVRIGIGGFRNPDAGLFPLLTSLLLGLFSLWLLSDAFLGRLTQRKDDRVAWGRETNWKNIIFVLVALITYALVLDKAGYLLTTFVFILFLFRVIEPQKWTVALLGATITALLSYMIFNVWLQTQLPEGVLIARLKEIL